MKASTSVCLALPLLLAAAAVRGEPPESDMLFIVNAGMLMIYAGIWLWLRPARFELTESDLVVVFPGRRLLVPRASIAGARLLAREEFRPLFGWAFRVGAGGLWGGFGWLWTSKRGRVDMFISRLDRCVLLERTGAPPLLLSAEPAGPLIAALNR
jgi:hypothetical protein